MNPLHRGYTVIELMTTVTVVAIAAAVAIPAFQPNLISQLESAADVVASDLQQFRHWAVTNNTSYRVTFDTAENRYYFEHSGSNSALNTLPTSIVRNTNDTATRKYFDLDDLPQLSAPVRMTSVLAMSTTPVSTTNVEYGPLGSTTAANDTVVWLSAGSGDGVRYVPVRVNAVTGLAVPGAVDAVGPTTSTGSSGSTGS